MWKIIYNILTFMFLPFFILFSLTRKKIRKNILERLIPHTDISNKGKIWIHSASIGEALIAENLVHYMKDTTDFNRFLITTNTHYSGELLERKFGNLVTIQSLPLDFLYSMQRFLRGNMPSALLIIETEIWPNLIWQTKKGNIPVMIVNGRISDSTIKNYRRFAFFLKHVLSDVDYVLAQSEEHRNRYISLGLDPQKVINTGNIKYYRKLEKFSGDVTQKEKIITYGSIKEKELDTVFDTIKALKNHFPDYTFFVAPRELHLADSIERELSVFFRCTRYSVLKKTPSALPDIVVVDTVGDLLDIYRKSSVAFVGGSLAPYGGQNILEPLFFGTPVLFGPSMENFRDIAQQVIERQAGIMVADGDELVARVVTILEDTALMEKMGEAGKKIIQEQQEVMSSTVHRIIKIIQQGKENMSVL